MTPRTAAVRWVSAATVGGVAVLAAEVGGALLLYGGPGVLAASGSLLALYLAALGAGAWASAPDEDAARAAAPSSVWRWRLAAAAFLLAALFAVVWIRGAALRQADGGRAVAVVLLLAMPGYSAGSLLAVLAARRRAERPDGDRGEVGAGATIGGVIAALAGAALIPSMGAVLVLLDATLLLALVGIAEARAGAGPVAGVGDLERRSG